MFNMVTLKFSMCVVLGAMIKIVKHEASSSVSPGLTSWLKLGASLLSLTFKRDEVENYSIMIFSKSLSIRITSVSQ